MSLARSDLVLVEETTVTERAQSLGVSRQSLYYQPKLSDRDLAIKQKIITVMQDNPSYGHKRIALELKLNKKRILRVMKLYNLKPYRRRIKKPDKLADQGKMSTVYLNLIKKFCPIRLHVVWVTDFTYLWFQGSFVYLATVMDLYTRQIVGWHVSRYHDRFLVIAALTNALAKTQTKPIYHHSDQGSEYDSADYLAILKQNNTQISMSQKSSPWENGFQESFYSQFKVDLGHIDRFDTLGELIEAINQQIYYYNHKRIHTTLKMPPVQFAKIHQAKILTTIS